MRRGSPPSGPARIAIVGADAMMLARLRGSLIGALIGSGHAIRCFAPQAGAAAAVRLAERGAELASYPFDPSGAGTISERTTINALAAAMGEWQPRIVVASGRRTTLLAIEAAAKARIARIVPIVSGLGALELGPAELGSWFVRARRRRRLKAAFAGSAGAIFHNASDVDALSDLGLLPRNRLPLGVVNGAGVPLADFASQPLPSLDNGMVFMLMASMSRLKGVETFYEAAKLVKRRYPEAQFVLVGPPDTGPHAIDIQTISDWSDVVRYEGITDAPHEALARSHIVVLPSFVEGMSRTLMEAASIGRPLIASDIPGCRAAVDERINGCLVPPQNAPALAEAMISFLERPEQLPAMARASRAKAERRFDEREIVQHEVAIIIGHASSNVGVA